MRGDKFLKKFGYKGQERDTEVVGERELKRNFLCKMKEKWACLKVRGKENMQEGANIADRMN